MSPLQLSMVAKPWTAADFASPGGVLGVGRSAHIVRATELATGEPCEVKVYDQQEVAARNELAQVRRSLDMQWRCRGPGVVAIYGRWLALAPPTPQLCMVRTRNTLGQTFASRAHATRRIHGTR